MGINTHDPVPQHSSYPHYDHLLTIEQKISLQEKINAHAPLLAAIDDLCLRHHITKEEIYDMTCKLFFIAQKSEKNPRRLGELHYLPTREKRFGREEGVFLFEHIVMNIYPMLQTITHSKAGRQVIESTAPQLAAVVVQNRSGTN